jgi:haloalkane dehalogenase
VSDPAWLDRAAYPFASHWLDHPDGRMHYLDEGDGRPLVMVHGTPTWSFLYRHLVSGLRDRYRCVVPDHLGFGLSEKSTAISYRPADQAARLARLVGALGLRDLTLVVHDFGGPIGLAYALEHPENVRTLVVFNTWLWSLASERRLALAGRLFGSPLGRFLYERLGVAVGVMWTQAIGDRTRYTPAIHAHYAGPLATPVARHATWIYARELLGSSAWYDDLWSRRGRIASIPALLVWGPKDPAFGSSLERWRTVFMDAEVVEMAGVGHAPQEERGPETAGMIRRFLDARDGAGARQSAPVAANGRLT